MTARGVRQRGFYDGRGSHTADVDEPVDVDPNAGRGPKVEKVTPLTADMQRASPPWGVTVGDGIDNGGIRGHPYHNFAQLGRVTDDTVGGTIEPQLYHRYDST